MAAKRKRLKYQGACMFKVWELPNGQLRFEADLEDVKGLEVKKPAPKRKPK